MFLGLICLLRGLHCCRWILLLCSFPCRGVDGVLIYILLELHVQLLLLPLLLLLLLLEWDIAILLHLLGMACRHGVYWWVVRLVRLLNWHVLNGILCNISWLRMDIFMSQIGLNRWLLLLGRIALERARNLLLCRMIHFHFFRKWGLGEVVDVVMGLHRHVHYLYERKEVTIWTEKERRPRPWSRPERNRWRGKWFYLLLMMSSDSGDLIRTALGARESRRTCHAEWYSR